MSVAYIVAGAIAGSLGTGVVGGCGFLVGRALNRSERRVRQDVNQDTQLALIQQRVTQLERESGKAVAHRQAMGEELAALASSYDGHVRWHERSGTTTPHGDGS